MARRAYDTRFKSLALIVREGHTRRAAAANGDPNPGRRAINLPAAKAAPEEIIDVRHMNPLPLTVRSPARCPASTIRNRVGTGARQNAPAGPILF